MAKKLLEENLLW